MLKMKVVGVKEVTETFGDIAKSFKPRVSVQLLMAGAEVVAEEVRNQILDRELVDTGALYDSVEAYKINQWSAGVRVTAAYAAAHEYGLENQVITERQRRFFWAMWAQTGNEMWKALALSTTYTIPARPYFRPAIDVSKKDAVIAIMQAMAAELTRVALRHGGKQ